MYLCILGVFSIPVYLRARDFAMFLVEVNRVIVWEIDLDR